MLLLLWLWLLLLLPCYGSLWLTHIDAVGVSCEKTIVQRAKTLHSNEDEPVPQQTWELAAPPAKKMLENTCVISFISVPGCFLRACDGNFFGGGDAANAITLWSPAFDIS